MSPRDTRSDEQAPLLDVRHLSVGFADGDGWIRAVDDLSFTVNEDEVLGIVGESGSGKSISVKSIPGLLPSAAGVLGGEILFRGKDLLQMSNRTLRREIRGSQVSMIFQDPMSSLNPVMTVGAQIVEAIRMHSDMSRKDARKRAEELLATVGMTDPHEKFGFYPHQFSGGMRQRVMVSMAIATNPALVIADEPTTALDVTVQKQVMDIFMDMRAERGTSVILISHDLDLVADFADRIVIMYAGEAVESGSVRSIFTNPKHPYTRMLLRSIPTAVKAEGALPTIAGTVPHLRDISRGGCRIAPRIPWIDADQHEDNPQLREVEPGHWVRCTCHRTFEFEHATEDGRALA